MVEAPSRPTAGARVGAPSEQHHRCGAAPGHPLYRMLDDRDGQALWDRVRGRLGRSG